MIAVRRPTFVASVTLVGTLLGGAGCAGVRVYSDPAMTQETGIKVFSPKPYLLVSRTGAKDKPIELSIVYLPDATNPHYVKQKGGWGSNEMSVKLNNGILSEFGTKSDSKIPESLTAVGSLLSAAAGAYKTVQEGSKVRDEGASREELDAAAAKLQKTATDLAAAAGAGVLSTNQRNEVAAVAKALQGAATTILDPTQIDKLDPIATVLAGLVKKMEGLKVPNPATDAQHSHNSTIDTLMAEVKDVIEVIRPKAPELATFELYEIVQKDGKTHLVRVEIGL